MKQMMPSRLIAIAAVAIGLATAADAQTSPASAPAPFKRNWSPPAFKIKGQVLADAIMAQHAELIGVTFHAIPPGMSEFTMFAGSYHDRIGKVSGPDDAMAMTLGRIMIETRYKATDNPRKVVVLVPLQDAAGDDVGTVVFGFRDDVGNVKAAGFYISAAIQMRDALRAQIASHDDLFHGAD